MRALEALPLGMDGGRLPAGLEGPRAGGWDIEIEHSVQRVDHLSDVQRRRVARVVQVLTGLSGIAMVGQAHLIPQRSASRCICMCSRNPTLEGNSPRGQPSSRRTCLRRAADEGLRRS